MLVSGEAWTRVFWIGLMALMAFGGVLLLFTVGRPCPRCGNGFFVNKFRRHAARHANNRGGINLFAKRCLNCGLALAVLILLAATPLAQTSAAQSSPKAREQTFQKVWEVVRDKFFDPNFNGVDWNAVHARYAPLVASVGSDNDLYDLLDRMMSELHSSHMEIIRPDAMAAARTPPALTGLGVRDIDGHAIVSRVLPGSSAERAGIRLGYILQRVDGVDVTDLNRARVALSGPANTQVRVTVLDEHDAPREVTLDRRPLAPDQASRGSIGDLSIYSLFESKRLEGGIGYLRFSTFLPALDGQIRTAIQSMHDAPGLIIDLRGNAGGEDSAAIHIANQLLDKPTVLMITRRRTGDVRDYRATPVSKPFTGPLVILIDEESASQSEQFSAALQEIGRAVVIGRKTKGSDMDADLETLPTGAYLVYAVGQPRTPKGVVIEGRGVIPDKDVSLTRAGLLAGDDDQLSAAVRYLAGKRASRAPARH